MQEKLRVKGRNFFRICGSGKSIRYGTEK